MMSKHTQKEIERMRMDGYGPTRIARELGLSINTVKSPYSQASRHEKCCFLPAMRERRTADAGQEAEEVLFQHMPQPLLELSVSEGRPRWKKQMTPTDMRT